MAIIFGPLTSLPIDDIGRLSMRIRTSGIDAGATTGLDFGRAVLVLGASGEDEHAGDLVINIPDAGSGKLILAAAGEDGGLTSDSGAMAMLADVAGFDLAPGQDAGDANLRLRARGQESLPPLARGDLIAPTGVMLAFGGLRFVVARDRLGLGSGQSILPIPRVRERLAMGSAPRHAFDGAARGEDALALGADPTWMILQLVRDLVLFGADGGAQNTAIVRAVERLLLAGRATHVAEAVAHLVDALVLAAMLEEYRVGHAAERVLLASNVETLYEAFARAVDRALFGAAPMPSYTAMVVVREDLVLGSRLSHEADFVALVRDSVGFAANLTIDNGEYIAWVLNTQSKGLSRYTQYPFNSFARIGGRFVGAAADGLHWLDGDTDDGAPIEARLRLGLSGLGDRKLKRVPDCFIGYTSTGQLLLKAVTVDEQTGDRVAAIYRLRPRAAGSKRENAFKLGRGMRAVDWDFEIENVDGAGFDLSDVQFNVLRVERRTRG